MHIRLRGSSGRFHRGCARGEFLTASNQVAFDAASRRLSTPLSSEHPHPVWTTGAVYSEERASNAFVLGACATRIALIGQRRPPISMRSVRRRALSARMHVALRGSRLMRGARDAGGERLTSSFRAAAGAGSRGLSTPLSADHPHPVWTTFREPVHSTRSSAGRHCAGIKAPGCRADPSTTSRQRVRCR